MSWAAIAVGVISIGAGVVQTASANKKAKKADAESKRLFSQRKAYQTPKEILDIVGMSQNQAQSGFSPQTMNYLTNENDRATAGALGRAKLLGANANDLSSILDQSFQNIFKIGSENELVKMKKFDALLSATQLLGQSRDAEWASDDNLLKDQMQLQWAKGQAAQVEKQSGANLIVSGISGAAQAGLYNLQQKNQYNKIRDLEKYNPQPITPITGLSNYNKPNINAPANITAPKMSKSPTYITAPNYFE